MWSSTSPSPPTPPSLLGSERFCSLEVRRIHTPISICLYFSASGSAGGGGGAGGGAGSGATGLTSGCAITGGAAGKVPVSGAATGAGSTAAGGGGAGAGAACAPATAAYSEGNAVAAITSDRFAKLFFKVAFIFTP